MKKKVQAGMLDDAGGLLKQLANTLFKGLDALIDHGLRIRDKEVTDDGNIILTAECADTVIKIKVTPCENMDGYVDLHFKTDSGKEFKKNNVHKSKMDKTILEVLDDNGFGPEDVKNPDGSSRMNSSHKLEVTLKRVCASTGDTIHLTAINANYAATKALEDLDAVLSDDSFIEQITEEPVSYSIVDEGETFDVNPIAEVNAMDGLRKILCGAFNLMHTAQCVCWNAKGDDFHELRAEANDLAWSLNYQIDTIAELCVEFNGFAPHPNTCTSPDCAIDPNTGFTKAEGLDILRNAIEFYIGELEGYRCNFPSDVQSKIDEWVRNVKHRSRYTLNQIQKI